MSQEQDKAFFRNFTIVLIVLAVLMITFMILGSLIGGEDEPSENATAEVMKNTEPVAKVQMKGDEPEAPAAGVRFALPRDNFTLGSELRQF